MFNDKYGLTQAVLNGRKTQTRRVAKEEDIVPDNTRCPRTYPRARYKVGEIVAVAQSYKDVGCDFYFHRGLAGWNNKMFVKAEEMPHRIKITNIRVERLQDITKEDCLKEGIRLLNGRYVVEIQNRVALYTTDPKLAYGHLVEKICGKGT